MRISDWSSDVCSSDLAEPGTTVTIDVDRNLTQAKDAIGGFVDAYNSVRSLLNLHLDTDPATGKPREDATLFGSTALADIETRLSRIVGAGPQGARTAFSVLAPIGIGLVGTNALVAPPLANTQPPAHANFAPALHRKTQHVTVT